MCYVHFPKELLPVNKSSVTQGELEVDGLMRLALRYMKSINVNFLNQVLYFSIKQMPNFPHEAGWTAFQNKEIFKMLKVPVNEPAISWLVDRYTNHSANKAVNNIKLTNYISSYHPWNPQILCHIHRVSSIIPIEPN